MNALRRAADGLIGLSAAGAALALAVMLVVILIDVVGRALGTPLYGSQDMSTMAMVVVVFGAMALCDRRGGHIAVDLIEPYLPAPVNRAIDIIACLLGAIIFAAISWAIWDSARLSQMLNLSTNLLRLPKAWFQWALVGFAVVTALGLALRAVELAFRGHDVRKDAAGALGGDPAIDPE